MHTILLFCNNLYCLEIYRMYPRGMKRNWIGLRWCVIGEQFLRVINHMLRLTNSVFAIWQLNMKCPYLIWMFLLRSSLENRIVTLHVSLDMYELLLVILDDKKYVGVFMWVTIND